MIRPWYRSRLFWLGIPGLLFLLWWWLASQRPSGFVGWMNDDHFWSLGHSKGYVEILWIEDLGEGFEYGTKGFRWDVLPQKKVIMPPPTRFERQEERGIRRETSFRIADWIFVLTYLSAWWAASRTFRNRRSRLLTAPASPP